MERKFRKNDSKIRKVVMDFMGIDILHNKKSRAKNIVLARHVFFYLSYNTRGDRSIQDIADYLNKSHSTVIHSNALVENLMKIYPNINELVNTMLAEIKDDYLGLSVVINNEDEFYKIKELIGRKRLWDSFKPEEKNAIVIYADDKSKYITGVISDAKSQQENRMKIVEFKDFFKL